MNYFSRIVIFLFVVTSAASALPLRYGFVLSGEATVYADSSLGAEVLETLQMTAYRYVAGEAVGEEYNFNFNGWAKILTADSTWGWIDYQNLLISSMLTCFADKDEPLFQEIDPNGEPVAYLRSDEQLQIFDIEFVDNVYWFKVKYRQHNYWYKPKENLLDFNLWGALYAASEYMLYGTSSSACDAFIEYPGIRNWYPHAEAFLLKLKSIIDPYAGMYLLPIYDEYFDDWREYGAGAFVNRELAHFYETVENWNAAIQVMEEIVVKYPNQQIHFYKAGPSVSLDIARIYRYKLGDEERAIEKYHFVIQEYQKQIMIGWESEGYADESAAEMLYSMIESKTPEIISEHANRMSKETHNPTVKLIANKASVLVKIKQGDIRSVGNYVYAVLERYPNETVSAGIKVHRNISAEILEMMFDFYYKNQEFEMCIEWTDKILADVPSIYALHAFCLFKKAELYDNIHQDKAYARHFYESAIKSEKHYNFYCKESGIDFSVYHAEKRYSVLNESVSVDATVLLDSTWVYKMRYDTTSIISVLNKDDHVIRLCTDNNMIDYNEKYYVKTPRFAKVLLSDSTIGWVHSRNLFVESPATGIADSNSKTWSMPYGDSQNNLYFKGPDIYNPAISGGVFDQSFSSIRFSDVNQDGVLDYVLDGFLDNSITTINGKNHLEIARIGSSLRDCYPIFVDNKIIFKDYDYTYGVKQFKIKCFEYGNKARKQLWELDTVEESFPVVHNNHLYYFTLDSLVACVDVADGNRVWKSKGANATPLAIGLNNKAVVFTQKGAVTALDPKTGEEIWSKSTSKDLDEPIPVLDENHVYTMLDRKYLAAINLESGEILWSVTHVYYYSYLNDPLQPIVTPDYILFSDSNKQIVVLDKYTGKLLYRKSFDRFIDSYCIGGNTIYVQLTYDNYPINIDNNIYAFNLTTGKEQWRRYFSNDAHIVYQAGKLFISGESGVVIVEDGETLDAPADKGFTLHPNYPNPFNLRTVIQYVLYNDSQVNVDVFNVLGQKVASIVDEKQLKGVYHASWNGRTETGQPVSSGVYLCRINVGGEVETRTMMLLK